MVYCPGCGTANRDGSRFCNACGTKLPTMTSSLCPTCGTPNPPHSLFCEKCGTRLIASLAEESEGPETPAPAAFVPKGLSLPTITPAGLEPAAASSPIEPPQPAEPIQPAEEEMPDWMQVVQSAMADTSESDIATVTTAGGTADQAAPEEVPEWLSDLGLADQSGQAKKPPTDEPLPEWTQRLRTMPDAAQPSAAEEEEVPEWLKTLGTTGQLPVAEETPAAPVSPAAEETLAWMANLGTPTEPVAAEEEELPEWLKEPSSPYFSTEPSEPPPPPSPVTQAQPAAEEMPDWLRDLRPATGAEDALPDWLDELGVEERPAESMALSTGDSALDWLSQLSATAPETPGEPAVAPDWMSSLRTAAPEVDTQPTEESPDWMSSLRATSIEPEATAEEEGVPDWLKGAGLAAAGAAAVSGSEEQQPQEPTAARKVVTDWLAALRQATPEMEAEQAQSEEVPEWMRETGAVEAQPAAQSAEEIPEWLRERPATFESTEEQPTAAEEEGVPDWLKGAGLVAAGAAAVSAFEEEQPQEPSAPQKPVTDWLSALRQAAPEMEAEQAQSDEVPEWMRGESGVPPEAIGGQPAYEQEVPEWLRATGAGAQQPAVSAEEEIPEWLRETRSSFESAEEQPTAQVEEEGVPDWMKGFGAVAGAAAAGAFAEEQKLEEAAPQKPATDWLTTLRRATPEIEAEQPSEEAEPEWLREESGAAPQAIGGVQSYDQEVPDWLREESGAAFEAAQPPAATQAEEEEGVPDWLKGLGGAAVGAVAVAAAAPRAEEPSDAGLPDWLREETAPPAAPELGEVPEWLREAAPTPAISFETPQVEEAEPGETPEWLRELAPTAAVTGAAMAAVEPEAEEPEEIEQPEEAAESEPEAESWASKAAPVAAAGLAAAAVAGAAKQPEKAEAAPAEMPEWLKEIRQEQQIARTAIPVPPPEAAGLTQAEIPAWLEALRPSEEAAAPQEAETPTETEGPLAGIANALPPAPIMGEMSGLPANLQFVVSAEDQARAGVLKELLTQHAVAPASVEQFVVKSSAIRRRALRWIVAFLIIFALFVPVGIDINDLMGLPLLPKATTMVVPPATGSAAFEISLVTQQPNSKVLVVFDYDAAQAGELNRVAAALLQSPALQNAQIEVASLNPQGSAVAQTVLKDLPNLQYVDRGFVPGQVNGVQSLLSKAGDVKLIIELAASPETVRWWVEQLKANQSDIPLVVGVSAGAEPLTMPYLQSGQVKGLVSGFPGAVAYLNATGTMNTYSQDQINNYQVPLEGLTLANYVMVALIVVGLIAALLRGAGRRSA